MSLWGIVVAGGAGVRYGTLKQLEPLSKQRVLDYSVAALTEGPNGARVDGVVVVVPEAILGTVDLPGDIVVAGGATRAASVRAGLEALPSSVDRVLVHDGARPLLDFGVIRRVVSGLDEAPATVPVIPVTDSLRSVGGGAVDRSAFVAVQTPQGFHREVLERAHEKLEATLVPTDDASMVDAIGEVVLHVAGDPMNLKITEPADLAVAETLMARRAGGVTESGTSDA